MEHLKEFARMVWHGAAYEIDNWDTRNDPGTNSAFEDWYRDLTAGFEPISLPTETAEALLVIVLNQRSCTKP